MRYAYLKDKKHVSVEASPTFDFTSDIAVIGLGSAGSIAAITAAEYKKSVIGIERLSTMGGLSTAGCLWDYYYGIPGGRGLVVNDACQELNREGFEETNKGSRYDSFSSAVRSMVLERQALAAGCRIFYNTALLGVYLEENRVVGVRCMRLRDGKTISVRCKTLLDCTGDALASRMAGCETQYGRSTDGMHIISSSTSTMQSEGHFVNMGGFVSIGDCSDDREFTEINLKGAVMYPHLCSTYQKDDRMLVLGEIFGMRDGHRIVPDEPITFADFAAGYRTENPVFYAFSQVDDPNFDVANAEEVIKDWKLISGMDRYGIKIGIPLGAMLPKGKEGILTAGKGLGIGYDLQGCVRMRWDMEHSAEAAAVAACLAIDRDVSPRGLDQKVLADELRRRGVLKDTEPGYVDLQNVLGQGGVQIHLPQGLDEIRSALSEASADCVFWAVRNEKNPAVDEALREWMTSKDAVLRRNSAIAAGLRGDRQALPILRETVLAGPEIPEKVVHYGFLNMPFTSALCLLGRLGDAQDAALLINTAEKGETLAQKMPYSGMSYFRAQGDWTFHFVSIAVAALIQLDTRHPSPKTGAWLRWFLEHWVCPETSRGDLYVDSVQRVIRQHL